MEVCVRMCRSLIVSREAPSMSAPESKQPSEYTDAELVQSIRTLVGELSKRRNNVVQDTGASLIPGTGKVDVRPHERGVQIGIETEFGWVLHQFDVPAACGAAAAINSTLQSLFATVAAQAEIAGGNVAVQ